MCLSQAQAQGCDLQLACQAELQLMTLLALLMTLLALLMTLLALLPWQVPSAKLEDILPAWSSHPTTAAASAATALAVAVVAVAMVAVAAAAAMTPASPCTS